MNVTISVDKTKIGLGGEIAVTAVADENIYAYEARIVPHGTEIHRGVGTDVLSDEGISDTDGIVVVDVPTQNLSFVISGQEMAVEGAYDLFIYVRDVNGEWWPKAESSGGSDEIIDEGDE